MGRSHVIAVPYPAQGHVIPMLELSQWLVKNGVMVTFVNTAFDHERVVQSLSNSDNIREVVNLVSLPDGLEPGNDRSDLGKQAEAIFRTMPGELEDLIERINEREDGRDRITCVLADWTMGWALDVAEKMGLRKAVFWPAAAASLASLLNIPKFLNDGIVDINGRLLKNQSIQLSPDLPLMSPTDFIWTSVGDEATQKIIFEVVVLKGIISGKLADWLICNSSHELERGAFSLFPDIIPIGPLLASNRLGKSVGHYWAEDSTCLTWLDQQPPNSVVYVAFGSFTVFDHSQFQELARGLELSNRPFLWVVRQDITADADRAYPEDFKERVQNRGRMVRWAPQQQVLSHPSIAFFVSHCGWNSTVEGIGNGVPFLCWPYFADQFINVTYICDWWEVGLRLSRDEKGIIGRGEIKKKIGHLMSDKGYKERALNLQGRTMDSFKAGKSHKNFNNFVEWIKNN